MSDIITRFFCCIMNSMNCLLVIYDNEPIKNLISAYQEAYDNVVFLYQEEQEELLKNPFIENYLKGQVFYQKYDVDDLENVLLDIYHKFPNLSIDTFGGDDYALSVCSGFAHEYHLRLIHPDIKNSTLRITKDDVTYTSELLYPLLNVKQYVDLMGASITGPVEYEFLEEDKKIVTACITAKRRTNQSVWASFCKYMQTNREKGGYYYISQSKYKQYQSVITLLYNAGMFSDYGHVDKSLRIKFAKPYFRNLVVDTGLALEYETYHQLVSSELFDDVDLRVNIDWNGGDLEWGDATSEIDIIAIKNAHIIFISCKIGKIREYDLYDVYSNAMRFGGDFAIPVFVHDAQKDVKELENKAQELGILLIQQNTIAEKTIPTKILKYYRKKVRNSE